MLTLNAPIFDIEGSLTIANPDPRGLLDVRRRVNRVPTLDGGAAINDFGYSDADRTLQIAWVGSGLVETEKVRYLTRLYDRLILSFLDGCFLVAPESFESRNGESVLTALIEKRLSE